MQTKQVNNKVLGVYRGAKHKIKEIFAFYTVFLQKIYILTFA